VADERFEAAIKALQRFEETVASVETMAGGGVYRCPTAPSLAPLNFVRVDDTSAGLKDSVTAARAAAAHHGLKTIVLDAVFGPNANLAFEGTRLEGEWVRVPRGVYVWEGQGPAAEHRVEQIPLDEFIAARRAFFSVTGSYAGTEVDEEEAAARAIAAVADTQQWGARVGDELVSIGEIYFIGETAQLESLSTLPGHERQQFGTAVTAARVKESLERGVGLVFAQIEAGNDGSIHLHENLGFIRVGSRAVFTLV
jgi:hypothetical protein